jgi:pimeloyl-ACP methyl ester carboxylesterase
MAVTTGAGWRLRQRASLSGGVVTHDHWGSGPPVVLVHGTPSWSYLSRNAIPILAKDSPCTPMTSHRLRQSIPGSRLRLIPQAGHFAMEDAPDAFAAELSRFFREG